MTDSAHRFDSGAFHEDVATLRSMVGGQTLLPEDTGYDDARSIWNAMFDCRPAVIVQARGPADVMQAVRFARRHDLELAIRGGGHNVAGNAVCDDGLMLDLSSMAGVRVDPERQTAWVEPGALLQDIDRETQAHGLATPTGFISETGLAGLTLGGGFGYLSRRFGLTADNLLSADVVTADGEFVRASDSTNPELLWALRGGGGNFGVVTAFQFALHPVGPQVLAGPVVHDFTDAPSVLREVGRFIEQAPDEVSCLVILRHAPPLPFLPESMHGRMILLLAPIHCGDPAEGEAALAPLRAIGNPIADAVAPRPYRAFQSMFDASATVGARNYWKSHYLAGLDGDAVDTLCEHAADMTSSETSIGMLPLGGCIARQHEASTPYANRHAQWVLNIQSRWREANEDERHIAWARETFEAMTPFSTGGVYVNFLGREEGPARLRAAYGPTTYQRLAVAKRAWDPDNVFRLNQNIEPA